MLAKIASLGWRSTLQLAKVAGVWKEIDIGYTKVDGVWRKFKWPYVAKGITLTLGSQIQGDGTERRSFVRSGNGPAVGGTPGAAYLGSMPGGYTFTVDGVARQIRGIETGSDTVGGPSWKWVSVQFFGNVDPNKLARVVRLNGMIAYRLNGSWNSSVDMTFITYYMPDGVQLPINTNLTISF